MGEAVRIREHNHRRMIGNAAYATGEVIQLPDGRAGVFMGLDASGANDFVGFETEGIFEVDKTATMVVLDGQPVYWDHSANKAHFKPVNDRDFFLGVAYGDWASADTVGKVVLNKPPHYARNLLSGDCGIGRGYKSVLVGTAAAGGFGYPVNLGGSLVLELSSTNEAQKVDALGVDGFLGSSNWIFEGAFRVLSDGGAGAQDFSFGVANGTHASDFQSVTDFAAIHLDGDNTNINLQSDDNTTDVAPTDSTKDYTEGSDTANRVHVLIDGRDPAAIKFYIDGVAVLAATVFAVRATETLFIVAHLEKTATTDTYKVAVDHAAVRLLQQDNVQR